MPQHRDYWTSWYNTDDPTRGDGDFETVTKIESLYGSVCRMSGYVIKAAQCSAVASREMFDQSTADFAPDALRTPCTRQGLQCFNRDQPGTKGATGEGPTGRRMCEDYAVRFRCGYDGKEPSDDDLFPQFDVRIYIILAVVPILIFLIRILWSYVFRKRRQRRLALLARLRGRSGSCSSDSTDDDLLSIASGLASPPPSYTELFGDSSPPHVFTIAGRSTTTKCSACESKPCTLIQSGNTNSGTRSSSSPANHTSISELNDISTSVSDSSSSLPESETANTEIIASSTNVSDTESHSVDKDVDKESGIWIEDVHHPDDNTSAGDTDTTDTSDSALDTPKSPHTATVDIEQLESNSTTPSSHPQPASTPSQDNPTPLLADLNISQLISPRCTCTCHTSVSLSVMATSGYTNEAFAHDTEPSSSDPSYIPGRNVPLQGIIRNLSSTSVITLTEVPSYEYALELLKTSEGQFKS